jgi:hypothetical protein
MQDDIHFPCVIQREEELGVFQKRHASSSIHTIDCHASIIALIFFIGLLL